MIKIAAFLFLTAPAVIAGGAPDLFGTIRSNDTAALRKALEAGADVNAPGERGVTPLMYAAAYGSTEAVESLLKAGAGANAQNAFGATALMWAVNQPDKVRMLLEAGADVNARTKQGRTALLLAAHQNGSEPVIRMLLKKGADPKAADGAGVTPIGAAAKAGDLAVFRLLLDSGADPNAADRFGFTPLINAAGADQIEMVKALLKKGANVNAVCATGVFKVKHGEIAIGSFTPLLAAATYGSPELVRALLDAGADINAREMRGMTSLMLSVTSEHQDARVVKLLLDRGADVTVKSNAGETANDWARKFGRPETLKLLGPGTGEGEADRQPPAQKASLANGARAGMQLMERTSGSFFKEGGCVSCHHQNLTAMAAGGARKRGVAVDAAGAEENVRAVRMAWTGRSDGLLQRMDAEGGDIMLAYSLLGLHALGHGGDATTDAMVFNIAANQHADGSWRRSFIARPPSEDGDISRTTFALRSLQIYGQPGRKQEYAGKIARAAEWLSRAKPAFNEERNMQLLGLKWSGVDSATVQRLAAALLEEQRPDGGWGQNPYLPSDAYATGQTLYALQEAGAIKRSSPAYERGLAFLRRTQNADGSWHVKSRAAKFQPYFESGFPHGHDQWISAMGTGWATMAISGGLDQK